VKAKVMMTALKNLHLRGILHLNQQNQRGKEWTAQSGKTDFKNY